MANKKSFKMASVIQSVHRDRAVRKVGLDTDAMILLMDDKSNYSIHRNKIFNRRNFLFISYRVVSELIGYFTHKRGLSVQLAKDKIFTYLRKNNINLIREKDLDLSNVETIWRNLKSHREKIGNDASDNDLEIIAIYKSHKIDLITGRNTRHFKPFCDYIGIQFDSLIEDIDQMWKNVFGWKKRKY